MLFACSSLQTFPTLLLSMRWVSVLDAAVVCANDGVIMDEWQGRSNPAAILHVKYEGQINFTAVSNDESIHRQVDSHEKEQNSLSVYHLSPIVSAVTMQHGVNNFSKYWNLVKKLINSLAAW